MRWKCCLALAIAWGVVGTLLAQSIPDPIEIHLATADLCDADRNWECPEKPATDGPLGPTPLNQVGILQNLIYGDTADQAPLKFSGWLDMDYTYRSTGPGRNN